MDGNVVPHLCASIVSAFERRDMVAMHTAFAQLMHLRSVLRGATRSNMRAIKPLLNAFGLHGGRIRPPRVAISGAELDEVIAAVQAIGIPEIAEWKLLH
jgi:dihydrodipicolinate synthase/N-acetylneuraminate lyase